MMNFSLLSVLHKYNSFSIFTHIRPDGDAIGSSLALGIALMQRGKKIRVFCSDQIPAKYSFLPGIEQLHDFSPEEEKGAWLLYWIAAILTGLVKKTGSQLSM